MTAPDRSILLPRGVWKAPVTANGCPILLVVDSRGERRKVVDITPDKDIRTVTAELRAWLNEIDPIITLT